MDWRNEWFEFDEVAYLNAAGQAPLPRVSVRAVHQAIDRIVDEIVSSTAADVAPGPD